MKSKLCPEGYEIVIETIPGKEFNFKDITLGEIEKLYKDDKTKSVDYVADADSLKIKTFNLYEAVKKIKKTVDKKQKNTKYRYKNSYRERMRKYEQETRKKMYE